MYSIQGLRTVGNSLPRAVNKILKKGGHNYSSILNNWTEIVGKKISKICYPKSIKTNKEFADGILFLNVGHGDQLEVEYSKKVIKDKINSFFGYTFINQIKIILLDDKINIKDKNFFNYKENKNYNKKINEIENLGLKKKLNKLATQFINKKLK